MNRGKSVLGMLGLSIACICAIGVSNSLALSMHECTKGEGIGTGKVFEAGCHKVKAGGGWETVKTTGLKRLIPTITVLPPPGPSPVELRATIAGIKLKVECSTLGGEASMENQESGEAKTVVGKEIKFEYSGCAVIEPAGKGCKVSEPIKTVELKSETSGLSTIYTPASGETFLTATISGCSVGALNGEKKLTGKIVGVNQEATPETTEATETSGSELKLGGVSAILTYAWHYSTLNGVIPTFENP
ncbi:MAG TPA: hypothetical protein VFJ57_14775 [Solirubrobacterales bacterium]|nr:hypothetical protein [Solirubrobacterales bacterium]